MKSFNDLMLGDAFELIDQSVPDLSIDLIFSDPVYSNLSQYELIADIGLKKLKDNRPILVFGSMKLVKQYITIFEDRGYNFIYQLSLVNIAKPTKLRLYNMQTWTTPLLWFDCGQFIPYAHFIDTIITTGSQGNLMGKQHAWGKNHDAILKWLSSFTKYDDLVLDPFSGYGSILQCCKRLNRQYIGFEINEETYQIAKNQLAMVMPSILNVKTEKRSYLD